MKIKFSLLFGIFFILNGFAHKDKYIHKKYGNVKVFMKTGFDYSDINKIKIVGKLSEELTKKLKYKDTLFIEYIQDYTNRYIDDVYFLENNNSNYRFIKGIDIKNDIESTKKGISVRIYADKINVLNILKLVEYAILNKNEINKYLSKQKIRYENIYEFGKSYFKTKGNSKKIIENIFKKETSELLKNIIEKKTVVENQKHNGIEIYWKNDEFIFVHKYDHSSKVLFKVKDYYYKVNAGNLSTMLIFIDKTNFYYIDNNDKLNKKKNEYKNGTNVPVRFIGNFKNKLLIFNKYDALNMMLIKENKMITEFK